MANHPQDPSFGTRKIAFSKNIYIESTDFMEIPPNRKYFRLKPEGEVRLRYGYVIKCEEVIKDDSGKVIELKCTYDDQTFAGKPPEGRKVKGIIHWVSADHAVDAEVKLYDRLFSHPHPAADKNVDFKTHLNKDSLNIMPNAKVEASLEEANSGDKFQFERLGYFHLDPKFFKKNEKLTFNRIITLRDNWAKK